jgi:hypothetical protein
MNNTKNFEDIYQNNGQVSLLSCKKEKLCCANFCQFPLFLNYFFHFYLLCTALKFEVMEGSIVNLDVTAPGATLALGLMFLKVRV